MISTTSLIKVSTSSNSTSSSSTSSPSILVTTVFPVLASIVWEVDLTGSTFGAINSYSDFFKIREGEPSPALRSFSIINGTCAASERASSTKSLSTFFGILLMDVIPRNSSSAKTSLWRSTAFFVSTIV